MQGHLFQGTISATYVVTPTLILDGAYGYFREDFNDIPPRGEENLGWTVFKVPGLQTSDKRELGWPLILIDGFAQMGAANNFEPHGYRDPVRDYIGNLSWNKGSHNLRFGTDINFQDINESQPQGANSYTASPGGFQFTQGATQLNGGPKGNDYNAFASFLLGLPTNAGKTRQFPEEIQQRMRAYSFYARDRWQITPKLTLNYGLRYERFPFPQRVGRGLEIYDFQNNTMLLCGLGSNSSNCGITNGQGRPTPRAGIAYRLNDTIVIRAGYGMTNDPTNLANFQRLNYPDLSQQVLNAPNSFSYATTLRTGFTPVVAPNLSSGVIPVPKNQSIITYDNNNLVRGYIQSWNFTVEKQFKTWIASAGYVATRSVDQLSQMDQNWSPIGTGSSGQILNQKFGRTAPTIMLGTLGTAKYDSLQARVEHRMANGFHVSVGYTYAHGSGYTSESSGATPLIGIPYLYDQNYGLLTRDIRQNVNLTWILESPFGAGKHFLQSGFAGKVAGGWQLSGVISAYNGQPFTATASNTSLNAQASSQRANCNATPNKLGDNLQFYDRSAFSVPATGQLGTCGYNSLVGPGVVNLDLGVDRNFKVTERFQLKFRA
ncbi:MAG: TonB-dependent receptor, partial [Acidobacteriota bacterium]